MTKMSAWIRVGATTALLATAISGAIVWRLNYKSIQINLSSDIYATLHPILYVISLIAVVFGFTTAISALRSPGNRNGWVLTTLLTVLVALCVWATLTGILSVAYAV